MIVTFRGQEREVVIDQVIDEPDVNYYSVEWHFADMSVHDHNALNITVEEDREILQQLSDSIRYDRLADYCEWR